MKTKKQKVMRNKLEKLGIVFALAFTVTSCSNDDNGNTNTPPTGEVAITGTAFVGQDLTADVSNFTDAENNVINFKYQWYRADDAQGMSENRIEGATESGYKLTVDDRSKYIGVKVIPNDGTVDGNESTFYFSSAVKAAATISPEVTSFNLGEAVSVNVEGFTEEEQESFTYQWYQSDDDKYDDSDSTIDNATASEYTLAESDVDKYIIVKVTTGDSEERELIAVSSEKFTLDRELEIMPFDEEGFVNYAVGVKLTAKLIDFTEEEQSKLIYQWYQADNQDGSDNNEAINGATNKDYTLASGNVDKYIGLTVTLQEGEEVVEEIILVNYVGPVVEN